MVTHHVEERLEQRVVPATAESAYELLREPAALATRVGAYFKQQEQPLPGRVALPLAEGAQPPLLVVSADGHGVTCLAAGMVFDGPVLPFSVVDAFRARQRDRLRTRMATQRLESLEAEGWNLDHTLDHAYRMTRAQYDRLVLVAPLLRGNVLSVAKAIRETFKEMSVLAGRWNGPLPDRMAEGAWRLSIESALGVMATSAEPVDPQLAVLGASIPDCHIATRAGWVLLNRPQQLFWLCRHYGPNVRPTLARVWREYLYLISLRFPGLHAEAEAVSRLMPPAEHSGTALVCRLEDLTQVRRGVELEAAVCVVEHMSHGEHPPGLADVDDTVALLEQMAQEPEPFLPRVAQLHPPWGKLLEELDVWRDFATLAPPRPRPLEAVSAAEHARTCLWRVLLRDRRHPFAGCPPGYAFLVALAPQEALIPDRHPDPAWSLSAGREYVQRFYPRFADLRRHTPVRRDPKAPDVGRNAPCPCGSGKKSKKCCGAA